MKIYMLDTKENGITYIYSDKNKLSCLKLKRHYWTNMDEGKPFENWEDLYVYTNDTMNKRKKKYNIMYHNALFVISNKNGKDLIENKFSDCVQFLDVINDDDLQNKYYLLNPFRSIDALDIDKSECDFMPNTKIPSTIEKYVFKKDVSYYPIFKLKYGGAVYNTKMYATDEFKDFIESNGITGLVFEEIFDFDKE